MKKQMIAGLIAAATLLIAAPIDRFAQQNQDRNRPPRDFDGAPPRNDFHRGGLHPRLLERLNLTDQQKQQIASLHENQRAAAETRFEQFKAADEAVRDLIAAAEFNEAAARAALDRRAGIQIELELLRLKTDFQILALLTADQKTQLETLRQHRPESKSGGREFGAPPRN